MAYAIVFSGGGALGSWEAGCYEHILASHGGDLPTCVTGASAGALNAAAICARMAPKEIQQLWIDLKQADVFKKGISTPSALWTFMKCACSGSIRPLLKSLHSRTSVLDTAALEATLTRIFRGLEHDFLSSPIWFAISLTNLTDKTREMFYKSPPAQALPLAMLQSKLPKSPQSVWKPVTSYKILNQALMGTTALPILFPPFQSYFDGGVLLNQPISPAVQIMDYVLNPPTKPNDERKEPLDLYVLIPDPEALGTTDGLPAIATTLLSTWLSASLLSQITVVKLRNQIRALSGQGPIRLCVVRPSSDFPAGLLDFGKKVGALIDMGRTDCEYRLKRFDRSNENTWY